MVQGSLFFSLPPELRHHVYSYVLLSQVPSIDLLLVCRDFYFEARSICLLKQLTFSSQRALIDFKRSFTPSALRKVNTVQVSFSEGELKPNDSRDELWQYGPEEILKSARALSRAIRAFPNLSDLAVFNNKPKHAFDFELKRRDLFVMSLHCHKLRKITVDGILPHIDFLNNLPQLQVLTFSGYMYSETDQAPTIFRGLKKITDIEIIPIEGSVNNGVDYRSEISPWPGNVVLTEKVLRSIRPLRRFAISERIEPPYYRCILNNGLVRALRDVHLGSLRKLYLGYRSGPSTETRNRLFKLLRSSNVTECVAVGSVRFVRAVATSLPRSIKVFRVLSHHLHDTSMVIDVLSKDIARFSKLETLLFGHLSAHCSSTQDYHWWWNLNVPAMNTSDPNNLNFLEIIQLHYVLLDIREDQLEVLKGLGIRCSTAVLSQAEVDKADRIALDFESLE